MARAHHTTASCPVCDKAVWQAGTWHSPCWGPAASCPNWEPRGKRKPVAAVTRAQSYFLGRIEGQAERSISCSMAVPQSSAVTTPGLTAQWCASGDLESLLVVRVRISHNPAESKKCPFLDWTFPSQPWRSDGRIWHKQVYGTELQGMPWLLNTRIKAACQLITTAATLSLLYWQTILR